MNYYNNKNGINTAAIGNQLHQHLAERARLQQRQDELWSQAKRGYNRAYEMGDVERKIGANTYAIDSLISKLIYARCRSGNAYSMAVTHLKREIARNQRIISSWEQKIREVQCGIRDWVDAYGNHFTNCDHAYNYVAKKKQKTAQLQRRLSELL